MDSTIFDALEYNPASGMFHWKVSRKSTIKVGDIAGTKMTIGYIGIGYKGKLLYAHRLAWLFHYGQEPPNEIDHINGDRADNRISNLRLATHRENLQNQKCHRGKHLPGIVFNNNRWVAKIRKGKERIYLGCYKTQQEAHEAYLKACP